MINLRCLSGAAAQDKLATATRPETTVAALEQAAHVWLSPWGGILSVSVYPNREGGFDEAEAVDGWLSRLVASSSCCFSVQSQASRGPILHLIERIK